MNNKIIGAIAFLFGAAIGSAATWKFAKTKYEKIANDEIESVREYFRKKSESNKIEDLADDEIAKYKDNKATDVSSIIKGEAYLVEDPEMYTPDDKPFRISPEEFGEFDDYEVVSITCYSDKVVENELGEILSIEEIDEIVGTDSLNHFGEYQADSVFVRNKAMKRDYEILLDLRNYSDIIKRGE
jgi:hypothetical protein